LKQGPNGLKLYKMAIKLQRPIPQELANAPQVYPWLLVFQRAFWDLIGDRPSNDSPIPWMVRQRWAEVHGLDEEATMLLHHHVRAQDLAFLGYVRNTRQSSQPDKPQQKFGQNGQPEGV
jgi:hypothetical protein